MSVIHLKKKDVVKSSVKGVVMEFDHEKLATILGVPGTNGICEYIKDVWKESKYTKPLEITRRFANDENLMAARRVKENGVWWIASGENRRRDDDVDTPEEVAEEEEERNQADFDWEAVIDEAAGEGESGSGEKFYDAEDKEQGSPEVNEEIPAVVPPKRYDYFEETFLTMCKLTRENGVWWIGSGENRRRDDDVDAPEEVAEEEEERN
ncbi:hypothetical protein Dimus_031939 [Dionaea muscipula]